MSDIKKAKSDKFRDDTGFKEKCLLDRRSFLKWLWIALGGIIVCELFWLVYTMIRPDAATRTQEEKKILALGQATQYQSGTVTAVPAGKLYLARTVEGGFLAMGRECTHLGCTIYWDKMEQRFNCPCHGSAFALNGGVIKSPATRPLDLYHVFIENGIVKVDLGQRSRRSDVNNSQAVFI